jgi:hypothetical protein
VSIGWQHDAPQQRLAQVIKPVLWSVGGSEEVVESPAALQGLVDCCDQWWPPSAGLEGIGPVGPEQFI